MSPPGFSNIISGESKTMTMRTITGKTLNRQLRDAESYFKYVEKLTKNTAPTLNRLANVATVKIPQRIPNDGQNRLALVVTGDKVEARRIAKALNVTPLQVLMGATVPVRFSRITVMVTFKTLQPLAKAA